MNQDFWQKLGITSKRPGTPGHKKGSGDDEIQRLKQNHPFPNPHLKAVSVVVCGDGGGCAVAGWRARWPEVERRF